MKNKFFFTIAIGLFAVGFFVLLSQKQAYAQVCPPGYNVDGTGSYATGPAYSGYNFSFGNPVTGSGSGCYIYRAVDIQNCSVCTDGTNYQQGTDCSSAQRTEVIQAPLACGSCNTDSDCDPGNPSCTFSCDTGGTGYAPGTKHCNVSCPTGGSCVGAGLSCDDGNPCTINDTTICGGECQGSNSGTGTITRNTCSGGACVAQTETVTLNPDDPGFCNGLISECGGGSPGNMECQTDFSISVTPVTQDVNQGNYAVYTVTLEYNKNHPNGRTFPTAYVAAYCPGLNNRCVLSGPGFISQPGYTDRGTISILGNTASLRLTAYTEASTATGLQGLQLSAAAGGLINPECYGYNASPAQGSCQPQTTANLNVVAIPPSNFPAVCDSNWRAVPGAVSTNLQPVGVYIPSASPAGAVSDSMGMAITGTDGKIYYQTCKFSAGSCSWAGFWSPVNMAGWSGAYGTTPPSGILSDQAPYMAVSGNYSWQIFAKQSGASSYYYNYLSNTGAGWNGWTLNGSQAWGTPTTAIDHSLGSGKTWQFRQSGSQVQYMCQTAPPPCDTLTTQNLSNLVCTPSQNSLSLTWNAAANPALSRQVVRVSSNQASTIDGSCAVIGSATYDPVNCKDTTTPTTNNFTATNLSAGTTYYVRVAALCTNSAGTIVLSPDLQTSCNTTGASCPALASSPAVTATPNPLLTGSGGQAGLSGGSGWTNVVYSYVQGGGTNATVNSSTGTISAPSTTGSLTISAVGTAPNGATNCPINPITIPVNSSGSCPVSPPAITFSPSNPNVGQTGLASLPSGFSNCSLSVNNSNVRLDAPANSGNFTAMAAGSSTVTGSNCSYTGGGNTVTGCSVSGSVTVGMPAPTANITCNGVGGSCTVTTGQTAALDWTCTNAITGSVNPGGYSGTTGSAAAPTGSPGSTTYTLTCTNSVGTTASSQVTVIVQDPVGTYSYTISPDPSPYTFNIYRNQLWGGRVLITNTGTNALNVTASRDASLQPPSYAYQWINISPSPSCALGPGVSCLMYIGGISDPLWDGTHTGPIHFTEPNAGNQDLQLTVNVLGPAPVVYDYSVTSTLNFTAVQNASPPASQLITITNTGDQPLDLTISKTNMAWGGIASNNVHLEPAGQPGYTQTLLVNITDTTLTPATRTGSVNFSHAQAGNKQTAVNYTITAAGGGGTAPQVSLNCNGSTGSVTVPYNGNCVLAWDTQGTAPTSCTATVDWSGSKNVNGGNETQSNITSAKTYTITCSKSGFSDAVSTVTVSPGPQNPGGDTQNTNLNAAVNCQNIRIVVTDQSTNEDGFRIYKSTTSDPGTAAKLGPDIASTGANIPGTGQTYTYTDSGLTANANYYYWVVAYKGSFESPLSSGQANNFPITAVSCTSNLSSSDKDIVAVGGTNLTTTACNGSTDALPGSLSLGAGDVLTFSINLCNQSGQGDATQLTIVDKFINLKIPTATNDYKFCFNGLSSNCSGTGGTPLTRAGDCLAVGSISPGQYSVCTGVTPGYFSINLNSAVFAIPQGSNTYKVTYQAELVAPATCSSLNICRFQNYGTISYFDGLNNLNRQFTTPLLPFLNGQGTPIITETR